MAAAHGITFSSWYPDMDASMERRDATAGELLAAWQEEVADGLIFTGTGAPPHTALQRGQVSYQAPDVDHAGIEPWVKRAARAAQQQGQQGQRQSQHTPHSSTPSAARSESVYRRAQRIAHALDSEPRVEPQAPIPMRSLDPPLQAPHLPARLSEGKPTHGASRARSSRRRHAHGRAEARRALDSDTAALMAELQLLGKQLRTARRKIGKARHQVAEVAASTGRPACAEPSAPACACTCQAQHAAAHFAAPPNCMFCCDCAAKQPRSAAAPSQQHDQGAVQLSAGVPSPASAEHASHSARAATATARPARAEQVALPSPHASPAHSIDEQLVGRVLVELGLAADEASRLQEMLPEQRRAVRRAVRARLRSLADGLDSTMQGASSMVGATAEPGSAGPQASTGPEPAANAAAAASAHASQPQPAERAAACHARPLPKQPQRTDTHARADRPTVEARDVYYIPPSCAAPLFIPRGLHSQRVPKRAGTTAGDPPRLATSCGQAVRAQPANRRTELPARRMVRRRAARYTAAAAHRPSAASIMRNVETAAQQLVFATQQALLGR